jgi:UDP-galactose transporter B1
MQCVLAALISFVAIQLFETKPTTKKVMLSGEKEAEKEQRAERNGDRNLNATNEHTQRQNSMLSYLYSSTTQTLALLCSNYALQYIDYPTQVLAKSCKPIPIMIASILIFRQRQSFRKIFFVSMITGGIALFMLQEGHNVKKEHTGSDTSLSQWMWGMVLVLVSLGLDGVTGSLQDHLLAKYKPSSYRLMFHSNLWAIVLLILGLMVTGEGLRAVQYGMKYPVVLVDIFLFSLVGALGQNFIYYTIYNFGALVCSIITTTRKFFTILFSVLFYGHTLTRWQWFAVVVVFTGLTLDMLFSKSERTPTKQKKQ